MSAFLVGFFGWKEHIYTRLEDPGMYVYNMLFTPQKIVNTRYRPLTLTQFLKPEISHVSLEPFILGISNFGNLPSPADWKHFVASIKDSKTNGAKFGLQWTSWVGIYNLQIPLAKESFFAEKKILTKLIFLSLWMSTQRDVQGEPWRHSPRILCFYFKVVWPWNPEIKVWTLFSLLNM